MNSTLSIMMLFRSIVDNGHKFKVSSHPRVIGGCGAAFRPQSVRTQWIPEDIHCYQALVLL